LPHYYFDIETTGLDAERDQIITIQFQKLTSNNGKAKEPLTILRAWDEGSSEEKILQDIAHLIMSTNPWTFVPVGNNLNFEFKFLLSKIMQYTDVNIDPLYFHSRPHIDLKHVMILLNRGRFKGYHLILNKTENGANVPIWYQNGEYLKIIKYVEMEAIAFVNFYSNMFNMFNEFLHTLVVKSNRRPDKIVRE